MVVYACTTTGWIISWVSLKPDGTHGTDVTVGTTKMIQAAKRRDILIYFQHSLDSANPETNPNPNPKN